MALQPPREEMPARWLSGCPGWLEYVALAAAVFVAASASIAFDETAARIAAVWPVNAIVVAWGFHSGRARWGLLAAGYAGNLCANLASGDHSVLAVLLPLANTLEIVVCLSLMDRRARRFDMSRPDHLAGFGFITAPLGAGASTILAWVIFQAAGTSPEPEALMRWFLADLLGLVVVTPALLALTLEHLRADITRERIARGGYAFVLLGATLFLVFSQSTMPILFLAPPALVLLAFELGFVGAALGVVSTTIAALVSLLMGVGPITLFQAGLAQQVLLMQFFLATCIFSCMPVAAILAQRKRLMERLQAEKEAVSASEALYRHLWEKSSDIILRIDPQGRLLYASPSIRTIGYSPDEMVNRPIMDFIAPENRQASADIVADALSAAGPNPHVKREHLVITKSGETVWLEGNPSQLRGPDGKLIEMVTVLRDISARRAAEERLAAAKKSAEAASLAKGNFLANMSHELRTPLTSIIGFTGLLAVRPSLTEEDRRTIGIVKLAGETLLAVVNDILDYQRLEAGGAILEPSGFDLADLIAECADLVRVQAEAKGLSLIVEQTPHLDLMADRARLRQILINLLGNAVKFTSKGYVRLSCQAALDGGKADVTIAISDSGIGIAPDKLATIFERFSQADGSVSRRFGGTGLGLSISRSLAQLMGGSIDAASDGVRGSTFSLRLRLDLADASMPGSAVAVTDIAKCVQESGRPLRILVADDNAMNRALICAMLAEEGMVAEIAEHGLAAAAAVACADPPFDLVLMDMQMPVMDGIAATREIRKLDGPARSTPVVAVTANVMREEIAACREAGMDGHLAKPITQQALIAAVQGFRRQASSRREQLAHTHSGSP